MTRSVERKPVTLLLLGGFIALFGAVLAIGGMWLITVGGSFYYLPAGIALVVSGFLLMNRRALGAWIYIAFFAVTVAWSLWEVGLNGWPLVARLVAFTVLLILTITAMPVLSERVKWPAALISAAAVAIASVGLAFFIAHR